MPETVGRLRQFAETLFVALTVALLVSGCAALPQPEIAPPTAAPPAWPADLPATGVRYDLDRVDLEIHTYRGGWMSSRAHGHVMTSSDLGGAIYLAEPRDASTAFLYFRPFDLVLDDPAARAAAGAGFESTRTAADIEATRLRMLGPRGFDSNAHPYVAAVVRWQDSQTAAVTLLLREESLTLPVPVVWSVDGGTLEAYADFTFDHSELGLEPYSAFAGAIAVGQPIRIQLSLRASRR
jgi:hypothetical protein